MDDQEFKVLSARLLDTARYSPPPDEEAHRWVLALDTAGGPERWLDADLYHATRIEMCRRHGIPLGH